MPTELVFLDNNFYRRLCTTKDGSALQKWIASIQGEPGLASVLIDGRLEPYITPFSILEALGITVPYPDIQVPAQLRKGARAALDQFEFVDAEAKKYFAGLDVLRPEYLEQRFREQSRYTHASSKPIERMHLEGGLRDPNLQRNLITALSFDYLVKYPYSRETRKGLRGFIFVHWLFLQNSLISSLSKYRLAKSIWDDAFAEMQQMPWLRVPGAEDINELMSLKTHRDLVDTELIHLAVHGYYDGSGYRRLLCVTCDAQDTIVARIRIYKTLYKACLAFVEESSDMHTRYAHIMNQFANGLILICNDACEVVSVIDVSHVAPFS
jgi:hypothetical protein